MVYYQGCPQANNRFNLLLTLNSKLEVVRASDIGGEAPRK
jgi:hypothetical protein